LILYTLSPKNPARMKGYSVLDKKRSKSLLYQHIKITLDHISWRAQSTYRWGW